jgi:hypothetical protein
MKLIANSQLLTCLLACLQISKQITHNNMSLVEMANDAPNAASTAQHFTHVDATGFHLMTLHPF